MEASRVKKPALRRATNQTQVEHAIWLRDAMIQTLHDLDDDTIDDLVRRGEHLADSDGYPAGGNTGSSSGTVSRPTENAVLAHYAHVGDDEHDVRRSTSDPTGATIRQLFAELAHAKGLVDGVARRRNLVLGTAAKADPDHRGGTCRCCRKHVTGAGEDRIRSGYCPACYQAFVRAGRPDRSDFEHTRRAELDARDASPVSPT